MKKVTINSQYLSAKNNVIDIDLKDLIKDIKVIKASLKTKVLQTGGNNLNIRVDFSTDVLGENSNWENVDRINSLTNGQELLVDISDELQAAMDANAKKLSLTFTGDDSLRFETENEKLKGELNLEYLPLFEFQDSSAQHNISIRKTGSASVSLNSGELSLTSPIISTDNNILPLNLYANFNPYLSSSIPTNGMAKGWQLNLQQFLIKNEDKNCLSFTYINEKGKEESIQETYFYQDEAKNKIFVSRDELNVDLDGKLIYKDKTDNVTHKITTKLESPSGINLVSSIEDIPGYELVDYEPEELMNVKNNIENLRSNLSYLKENIALNKQQLVLLALSKHILKKQDAFQEDTRQLNFQQQAHEKNYSLGIFNNLLKNTNSEYIRAVFRENSGVIPPDLIKRVFEYELKESDTDFSTPTTIPVTENEGEWRYFTKGDISCLKTMFSQYSIALSLGYELDGENFGSLALQDKSLTFSSYLYSDVRTFDDLKKFVKEDGSLKNIDANDELTKLTDDDINALMSKKEGIFTLSLKDFLSADVQINSLISTNNNYSKQIKDYENQLKKLEHQKELLEMQVPAHYLYNDKKVIYGFGKIKKWDEESEKLVDDDKYRLILISDAYENTIFISYESPQSSKISCITDPNEKTVLFEYNDDENGLLKRITDARNRKTEFEYDAQTLALKAIKRSSGASSFFHYDNDNNLEVILDQSGFGVKLTYENAKIKAVDALSLINGVKNGEIEYKELPSKATSFEQYVLDKEHLDFAYNNNRSTTLTNSKGVKTTYLFDKYGKVTTIYELKGALTMDNDENNLRVKEYNYSSSKVSSQVSTLPYSTNYLQDVCFAEQGFTQKDSIFFGDDVICGDGQVNSQYLAHSANHMMGNRSSSVQMSENMLSLLKEELSNKLSTDPVTEKRPACSHPTYMLSGWAKADSAFIITDEEPTECSPHVKTRKFEISAKIKYAGNEQTYSYSKTFDWRNNDWQYCALPITFESAEIESITCTIDYTDNTGDIIFTDLEFKEADWQITEYDAEKRPIRKQSAHSKWITEYQYDEDTNLLTKEVITSRTAPDQTYETTYEYNPKGSLLRTVDFNGIVKETIYNDKGMAVKSVTYHKSAPASKFYEENVMDEKGNVTSELNELGEETAKLEYLDGTGIIASRTDENGVKTTYGYNAEDELIQSSCCPRGVSNSNLFSYSQDFLTALSHNGFDITYDYDHLGRISKISIADEPYLFKQYDDLQEVTSLASGEVFRQVFNEDGKVKASFFTPAPSDEDVSPEEQKVSQFFYDVYGNLVFQKDFIEGESLRKLFLDKFGNTIKEETSQHGVTVSIENLYDDEHSKVESSVFSLGVDKFNYFYDYSSSPEPILERIVLPNEAEQLLSYDKLGRLDSLILDKVERKFAYLSSGDHTSSLVSKLGFAVNGVSKGDLRYFYDVKGNIVEIRENNVLVARYRYDSLSRLIREDNKVFGKTILFDYDEGGNLISKSNYPFSLLENLDTLSPTLDLYSYRTEGWKDQLMAFNGQKFDYDLLGNPILYRDIPLSWSHGRQLDSFGSIASFKYNSSGIRTSKFSNGFTTKFFLNGNKILRQQDASNTLTFFYGADGVVGFHLKNNLLDKDYYYKKNAQNDVIGIYNSEGKQIVRYEYDSFGKQKSLFLKDNVEWVEIDEKMYYNDVSIESRFVAIKNPFRYRSYYFDFETGLYYLNSRYYDPEIGRFINADDIGALDVTQVTFNGLNLYAYCLNNPVNEVDENGYFIGWLLLTILLGAIVGGTLNGVKAYKEGARGWGLFGAIIGGAISGGAMAGIFAFGGGLGLGLIGGFSFGGGLLLAAGIGMASEMLSYSVEALLRDDMQWNLNDFATSAFAGALKGIATFAIAFGGGKLGAFDKFLLNPLLKGVSTLDYNITYAISKILIGHTKFISPFAEFLFKSLLLGGSAAIIRKAIDAIFKKR